METGGMLPPHQLQRQGSGCLPECIAISLPRLADPALSGTGTTEARRLQECAEELRSLPGAGAGRPACHQRQAGLSASAHVEEEAHPIHYKEGASAQRPPLRLFARTLRRRMGPALYHYHPPTDRVGRDKRHHRHQECRHMGEQERREGQVGAAHQRGRRTEQRI